ncbi:5'/3'-nucleotidase SurE [Corynebacterium glyciniphilum]|uniref:5'/3'-nucleotidase SurE n=1 Tax=Corynebacterium glyciniphilum TaxID=1404244 RepID=UPI003DA123E9
MKSSRLSVLAIGAAFSTLVAATACASNASTDAAIESEPSATTLENMRVLLTNDDSMQASDEEKNNDGLGLYAVRKALCEAGADVVVIAPWAAQSGKGTAVSNSGTFHAADAPAIPVGFEDDCATAPTEGAVFGLCLDDDECTDESESATPADTVKFAMRGGLEALVGWQDRPELVVSGTNAGSNVASSVTDSGTLAAGIAALEHYVPAVAFSQTYSTPGSYAPENYSAAAEWGTAFIESLLAEDVLSQHAFLTSVNYPNALHNTVGEPKFTEVGTAASAYHTYSRNSDDSFEIGLQECEGVDLCEEAKDPADWQTVLDDNEISVSAITPDRTYASSISVDPALERLQDMVSAGAPAPVQRVGAQS